MIKHLRSNPTELLALLLALSISFYTADGNPSRYGALLPLGGGVRSALAAAIG